MAEAPPDPSLQAPLRPIVQLGNPVLRQIAQPIAQIHSPAVQTLIEELRVTLLKSNGVGIAAPQMGASLQLLIVASRPNPRYPTAPQMDPVVMINPQLVSHSEQVVKDWEGCLSIPGIRGLVPRYEAIALQFSDRHGNPQSLELSGFPARIFQHEFDHLSGLVFLDRLETVQDIITDQEYLKRMSDRKFNPHSL